MVGNGSRQRVWWVIKCFFVASICCDYAYVLEVGPMVTFTLLHFYFSSNLPSPGQQCVCVFTDDYAHWAYFDGWPYECPGQI
jgi:hypothetical protein